VLISPMIGITRFARFAGLARCRPGSGSTAAWLGLVPEFEPFNYTVP